MYMYRGKPKRLLTLAHRQGAAREPLQTARATKVVIKTINHLLTQMTKKSFAFFSVDYELPRGHAAMSTATVMAVDEMGIIRAVQALMSLEQI